MTNYPSSLNTNAEIPPVVDNITEIGGESINALREAVFALEATLGINPQGSRSTLVDRLSQFLNPDGTIKSAALSAAGLVSLPIDNDDIGASAGIEETKIDLDFTTQSLNDRISSNDIDIDQLQRSLNEDILNLINHSNGNYRRHDGYDIDVSGLTGQPSISTVEEALGFIYDAYLTHRQSDSIEHKASAISFTSTGDLVSGNNVQEAINSIDDNFTSILVSHRDNAHESGLSRDGYVYFNGQAAVNDASLKVARYVGSSGINLAKVGLINSAVIKGIGFDWSKISATSNAITVTVDCGTGTRSITVTGLDTADYPSSSSPRYKIKGIVEALNAEFSSTTNNFPVTAFESNGELVLQHNIARDDCTIKVSSPGNSAIEALGFADIVDETVYRVNNFVFLVNGKEFSELKTLQSEEITHAGGTTLTVSTNTVISSNQIVHIYNHSTDSANGTYRITSSSITSIGLSVSIPAGTFNYIVYEDVLDVTAGGNQKIYEFYIDENRDLIVDERAVYSSVPGYTGIKVLEASKDLDAGTITLDYDVSTSDAITLTVNGVAGDAVSVDSGFVGYVKAYGPDKVSYVTVYFSSASATAGNGTFTLTNPIDQDTNIYLGSTHFNAISYLEYPIDKVYSGLVGESTISDGFIQNVLERDIGNLNATGVINGLGVASSTSTTVTLEGGEAYVKGRYLKLDRVTLNISNFMSGINEYNIIIDENGKYNVFLESTAGYSLADIIKNKEYVAVARVVSSAGNVDTITDLRFFINQIASKVQITVDDTELGYGNFRDLQAAITYAAASPGNALSEIKILTDYTVSNQISILSSIRIIALQDLTLNADFFLNFSHLEVYGNISSTATLYVSSSSTARFNGTNNSFTTAATSLYLSNGLIEINGNTSLVQIDIAGDDCVLSSGVNYATLTFSSNNAGIIDSTTVENIKIENLKFVMSNSYQQPIMDFDDITNLTIDSCDFSQTGTLSTSQAEQSGRSGVRFDGDINDIKISNCRFTNLSRGIYITNSSSTATNVDIYNNYFYEIGAATEMDRVAGLRIESNYISEMHQYGIYLTESGSDQEAVIANNYFYDRYSISSTPKPVSVSFSGGGSSLISIVNNIFKSIEGINIIEASSSAEGLRVEGNSISECTTSSDYAIDISNGIVIGNSILAHTGGLLKISSGEVSNNVFENTTALGAAAGDIDINGEISLNGNRITIATNGDIISSDSLTATGNTIECDKIETSGSNVIITGNDIIGNSISEPTLAITGGSATSYRNISGNNIQSDGTRAVEVESGRAVISGNMISGDTGVDCGVYIGTSSSTSNNFIVSNNVIDLISGNYGIYIDTPNAVVEGNIISGTVNNGLITSASGKEEIVITGNSGIASGSGANIIESQSGTPQNVYIWANKGVISKFAFDATSGTVDDDSNWTITSERRATSSSSTTYLYVPLDGLPVGAILDSVDVHCNPPGSSGTINVQLKRRDAASFTNTNVGDSGGVDNSGSGSQTISIDEDSGTIYIQEDELYYVLITSTNSGNQFGQIIANVRY